jgi:hypothetical protein
MVKYVCRSLNKPLPEVMKLILLALPPLVNPSSNKAKCSCLRYCSPESSRLVWQRNMSSRILKLLANVSGVLSMRRMLL